jgi:protein PhnA
MRFTHPRRTDMSDIPACPQCGMENTWADGANYACADCAHEWPIAAPTAAEGRTIVRDSNGNVLSAGDTVIVIKDLKVKGSSIPLKQGTEIRNIRLVEDDAGHVEGNSDKIKGLVLKTAFLKRA